MCVACTAGSLLSCGLQKMFLNVSLGSSVVLELRLILTGAIVKS